MNKQERVDYIVSMFQKLNPDQVVNEDAQIRGTTISKLCEFDGGPYQRIKKWCEDKIEKQREVVVNPDLLVIRDEMRKCYELMAERNESYGQSWKVLSVQSIANLIEMKMNRIAKLGESSAKTLDEFQDTLNYACMALIKLKK